MCVCVSVENVLYQEEDVVEGNPLKTRVPMVLPLKVFWMQQQNIKNVCTVMSLQHENK